MSQTEHAALGLQVQLIPRKISRNLHLREQQITCTVTP